MIPAKEIDGELWIRAADHHQAIKKSLARPQRKPLTDAQSERLYRNIEPSRQQDAKSLAAFKRLLRVIEAAHGIKE